MQREHPESPWAEPCNMDYLLLPRSFRKAFAQLWQNSATKIQKVKSAGFHAMNDFFSASNHKCRAFAELSWRGFTFAEMKLLYNI